MSEVEVRHVVKRYPEGRGWLQVLNGVSLTVADGEFVAIQGPSGAGKSTLLHLIGGLDTPTDGQVEIDRQGWGELTPRAQARRRNERIGFVFQFYHLLPELTVLENTMLPALVGWCRGAPACRQAGERALELLRQVGLEGRLTHRPSELSGGEQQRVAIARALMNAPRLILCDEPTGNLDTASGAMVLDLLRRAHREQGATLILVTHDAALAEAADRVVHLQDGQIKSRTTSHEPRITKEARRG